jgi:membrane-bound inhibitor of C-type lysozyme
MRPPVATARRRKHLHKELAFFLALAASVGACGPQADRTSDAQATGASDAGRAEPPSHVFAFDCGEERVVVEYRGMEEVFLFLPDTTLTLPHVRSASGAKYGEGAITFWSSGEEASLEKDGRTVKCVMNRRASIIEDAKLSGMDFWATGNEPGWTLEIGSETSVLVINYGEDHYEFAAPEPSVDAESRRTLYELELDGRALVIELTGEACFDSMSGERFETTVTLEFGGRSYPGCGQALH